jgi:hypothetical protein
MDREWAIWEAFWHNHCNPCLRLPHGVGRWVTASQYQIWPWYHDKTKDVLYRQTTTAFFAYVLLAQNCTRVGNLYVLLGETYTIPTRVVPVSASQVEKDIIVLRGPGPAAPPPFYGWSLFWEQLVETGGGWMWQHVSDTTWNTKWIAITLTKGTALISTNGSYSWKRAPHVCRTGWALACRVAQQVITGSFHEFSCDHRGELLGIVAAHTLILHTTHYYHL